MHRPPRPYRLVPRSQSCSVERRRPITSRASANGNAAACSGAMVRQLLEFMTHAHPPAVLHARTGRCHRKQLQPALHPLSLRRSDRPPPCIRNAPGQNSCFPVQRQSACHYNVLHRALRGVSARSTHAAATSHHVPCRYSAAEWSAAAPVDTWDPVLKAAHARWGGGCELSHLSLLALLDLLCQLQATAEEVAEALLVQAPLEVQQVLCARTTFAYLQRLSHSLKGAAVRAPQRPATMTWTGAASLRRVSFAPSRCVQHPSSTIRHGRQRATHQTAP